ncbi:GAF domain-containing protein [Pontibacter ummariensis]|uniref:GAF domain-containing protein n=1 Tax=Pontibacter ummariensis TaxID=1610492 RepID=A0A239FG39_9BACT|nr:GAF domain-containing protein [Pontibacter ummariensis]PRY12273.1 GAF domain-containing protein [Pontibacter ummariensis]SNS55767.1 GAF domain-containing protein [Pontibacter ummariensis]
MIQNHSSQPATYTKPANIIPENDQERLKALYRYELLDTPPEEFFDKITKLASRLFKVPSAFVSLVDQDRVWFKANLSELDASCIDRDHSLCSLTIINDTDVTVFTDTHEIPSLLSSPYVSAEGGIRFYAGAPLRTHDGYHIGTVCVVDSKPRGITEEEKGILQDLAQLLVEQIELRVDSRKAVRKHDELQSSLELNVMEPLKEQNLMLEEAQATEERPYLIRKAHQIAQEMLHNTRAMLSDSFQDEAAVVPHPSMIAVATIAQEVAEACEPIANKKGLELFFSVASRRELMVDRELLHKALSLLLTTTIKYTPAASSVALDVYETGDKFYVEVSAEDSVLTEQDLRKALLKYAKLSCKPTGGESTSGLELPRAKAIIEQHNGVLLADLTGHGTGVKFVVAFTI